MKRHFIVPAALCAATAAATAQTSVTLWGIAEASVRQTKGLTAGNAPDQSGVTSVVSGVKNLSRWGIRVSEDLGSGLRALVELEGGLNQDTGAQANASKMFDRASYMGLQGPWGRLTFGRQTTLQSDAVLITDPMGVRFAGFNPTVQYSALSSHGLNRDYGNGGSTTNLYRLDNSIKYTGNVGDFTGQAMISLGEVAGDSKALSSAGGGISYRTSALTAAGAFSRLRDATGLTLDAAYIGAMYKIGTWGVGANLARNVAETSVAAETVQKVASIGITKELTPQLNLLVAAWRFERERTGLADDGFNRVMAFLEYGLSKRTVAFLEADGTRWRGAMQGTGRKHGTGVSLGLSHRF